VIVDEGFGVVGMTFVSFDEQPAFETVRWRVVDPDTPPVNWMDSVPAPDVIVPFVMLQLYVAPACVGTDATLPVLEAQMDAGAVMVATGRGVMATFALPMEEQDAADVTVTVRATVPDAFAVYRMALVPDPDVIVPPVMPQVKVAPARAGTDAAFPVLEAQTDAGAVMTAEGRGLMATDALPVEEHPLFVTVTLRLTGPVDPAVNWIAFVPEPEVIVPFVMPQE
jgi:hypothetical protein